MHLVFILTMPGRNTWNGRWSGDECLYAKVKVFGTSKKAKAKAAEILTGGPYFYSWPDGWRARIDVKEVKGREITEMRRKTRGFCGYEWMINSIYNKGEIEP